MINFSLYKNQLKEQGNNYLALTSGVKSLKLEDVIKRIMIRGSTVRIADVRAVFQVLEEVLDDAVRNGEGIQLPWMATSFSVTGNFDGPKDSFDKAKKHRVNLRITKGPLLRKAESDLTAERVNPQQPNLAIQDIKDSVTGDLNSLTNGGAMAVSGFNIKIAGDNAACGLWFIAEDGSQTKVTALMDNKPSRITALVPQLASGVYQVKVVTQFASGKRTLQKPRIAIYQDILTVS